MSLVIRIFFLLVLLPSHPVNAGPITKIVSLKPQYNSEVVQIVWAQSLSGGCMVSDYADTNPAALNHKTLVSVLLTAFATSSDVEVLFGGGCGSTNSNWIQTIKILRQ